MCTLQKPERGRMVVGITTTGTCVISAHHHQVASSNSIHGGVLDATLCDKVCQ